ncbi:hypothetical protein [Thermosediminibacter oceani]|uniref:HepT-like domain-containing protein n=1 Tax=Thermosediminibacter oceani (strain ATCC BAA-1034 / DSM 16646 / JW/IW-1228P) TaxID=555079 RepID=D9S1R3_THEOJ|nr:hypothetical protein [Thermosediminibacter oceani]ADL07340.1 conserved hypothetical protein [Thermosediminibacter oceani DSM 16646]
MNSKYLTLSGRIKQELSEIKISIERARIAWARAQESSDPLYLDSVALNLHDFYSGLERIFELIAENVDETKPSGSSWHQELLRQMATEIPKIRPAIISQELRQRLDEYRAFRHIVRNVYAHNFKADRIRMLLEDIEEVFSKTEN